MALPCAIAALGAHARPAQVSDYRPVFEQCSRDGAAPRLAIRRMKVDGEGTILTVDPVTLETWLERDGGWSCADTDDERQKDTRYLRAIRSACAPQSEGVVKRPSFIANGGLTHGSPDGSFVTGDLCPSHKPLARHFLEKLETPGTPVPLALSMSGGWLTKHQADFRWLRDQEHAGALRITWVDHSYTHPYVPGRRLSDNFLLMAGVDMRGEILNTERLLIENGETPSVFFRFPGLISNPALMKMAADHHLIVLGAGAWLAKSLSAKPGDVILVHPNGNEPAGLAIFANLLAAGKLPQPFRPIADAP
ncbi:MAG TPA: polysaccharide deacetylase [Alphaproteobacteria bacterium]|nr:polysaccharide deacetylase [Alphaproteobacteria bacterium]